MTDSSRPCWVLLRGLGREAAHWGDFAERCAQTLGTRVICLDLPGSGRLYRERSPDSIEGLRQAAAEQLMQQLPAGEPFSLLGISLGGMVALDWAVHEPERVQALVLANASSRLSPIRQRLKVASLKTVLVCLFDQDALRCERRIVRMVSNIRRDDEALIRAWQEIQSQRPVSKANLLRQLKAAGCYQLTHKPRCPVLVATSKADRMVSHQCSVRLAEYLSAALVVHDTAGHDIALDAPKWLLERMAAWQPAAPAGEFSVVAPQ